MFEILSDRIYRNLFAAQVVALLGTGLATVALGLLAFDLAEDNAAMVLGTVFFIKMVAYVGIAPVAAALADRVNRRALLVTLDLVRAGVALCLPFVTEVWQVYVLIFLLQSASAAFTPLFQATIPGVDSGWVQNSTLSTEDALAVVSQIAVRVDVAIESNGPHT
jgi:MFS family permease